MTPTRILVVDDHEVVRTGLRTVLESADGLEVVAEAATAIAAIEQALAHTPDLVLMDVRLADDGGSAGIDACRQIKSQLPNTYVLMFSSFTEREAVIASVLAGASGYITKNLERSQLIEAIRSVARGEGQLDSRVAGAVIDRLTELAGDTSQPESALTAREREVLALIARGLTNREIASDLVISEHTARNHVTSILNKLGFSRRAQAAAYAARLGLLNEEEPRA